MGSLPALQVVLAPVEAVMSFPEGGNRPETPMDKGLG